MNNQEVTSPIFKELIALVVREEMKGATKSSTVPQDVYCAQNGLTPEAIRIRLKKGIWQLGCEVLEVEGSGRHIDLEAVDLWVRRQGKSRFLAA